MRYEECSSRSAHLDAVPVADSPLAAGFSEEPYRMAGPVCDVSTGACIQPRPTGDILPNGSLQLCLPVTVLGCTSILHHSIAIIRMPPPPLFSDALVCLIRDSELSWWNIVPSMALRRLDMNSSDLQILQLIALHMLFAALGFCHVSRAASRMAEVMHWDMKAGEEARDGGAAVEGPLLGKHGYSNLASVIHIGSCHYGGYTSQNGSS